MGWLQRHKRGRIDIILALIASWIWISFMRLQDILGTAYLYSGVTLMPLPIKPKHKNPYIDLKPQYRYMGSHVSISYTSYIRWLSIPYFVLHQMPFWCNTKRLMCIMCNTRCASSKKASFGKPEQGGAERRLVEAIRNDWWDFENGLRIDVRNDWWDFESGFRIDVRNDWWNLDYRPRPSFGKPEQSEAERRLSGMTDGVLEMDSG